jgi:DNA-binding NarL/FixJ family response regulator
VRVLVASRDVRVRRALSGLLEVDGDRIVGAADAATLLLELDAELRPDLVLLELDRQESAQDLTVVEALARRGRAVIAVSSGPASCAAVLTAGARACLDKDADFTDRLAQAVRAVAGPGMPAPPARPEDGSVQQDYVKEPSPVRSSRR